MIQFMSNPLEDSTFTSGRGLCYVMRSGSLSSAGDVSMIPVGRARDAGLSLKGFIWLLKFYPSGEKVYVYIDKTQMKVRIWLHNF